MIFTRTALVWVALGAALAGSGCAAPAGQSEAASNAARAFYVALAQGDGDAACALMTPQTASKLEQSEGKPCGEAVTSMDLHGDAVRTVDVYGEQARIVLDGDTAFLSHFRSGWRVAAAGCTPRPELPYDCQVEA